MHEEAWLVDIHLLDTGKCSQHLTLSAWYNRLAVYMLCPFITLVHIYHLVIKLHAASSTRQICKLYKAIFFFQTDVDIDASYVCISSRMLGNRLQQSVRYEC